MSEQVYDAEAERAIIAAAIARPQYMPRLLELEPADFYDRHNALLLATVAALYNAGNNVEVAMIRAKLTELGQMDSFGAENIEALRDDIRFAVTYNFDWMLSKVLDLSKKRKLAALGLKITEAAGVVANTTDDIVGRIERAVSEISRDRGGKAVSVTDVCGDDILASEPYQTTGLSGLDEILMGLFGGQLVIIGARPGVGKSAIALQMSEHMSAAGRVLFVSLEMPRKQIVRRMITRKTGIGANKIRAGRMSGFDVEAAEAARTEIGRAFKNIVIVDNLFDFYGIVNTIKKQHYEHGLTCVVIDYLQLIRMKNADKRYLQIGEMTATLKGLSMKLNIPIVVLSQLNRVAENKIPELSELRESGNIEQDADVVIFPHRPNMKEPKVDLIVAKNRDGSIGFRKLYFAADTLTFRSADDVE
jgi:replicative DNA helicase